jgi:transposase-like protein
MAASAGKNGRQEAAAMALATGRTIRAAAQKANVSERALRNWMAEEGFRARVDELRSLMFRRAVGVLCSLAARAGRTLGKLLGSESEKVQLGAAKTILESTPRLREAADLAARLEILEAKLAGKP